MPHTLTTAARGGFSTERLVLIEHHDVLRSVLAERLSTGPGAAISAHADWHAALACIDAADVDVVVLDLDAPDAQALDICRAWRRHCPRAALIALSARAGTDERIRALEAGADQLLSKPVSCAELKADIARIRAMRQAGRTN